MYVPDMTILDSQESLMAIGWLEKDSFYPVGDVPEGFLHNLLQYCLHPHVYSRGIHPCDFCHLEPYSIVIGNSHHKRYLGSNVIQVLGNNGVKYDAPDLIYHYVEAHNYCPPQEFIDAVMNSEPPGSKSWWQSCRQRVSQLFAHSE